MRLSNKRSHLCLLGILLTSGNPAAAESAAIGPRLGVSPSTEELESRANLVFPDGRGLPAGSGTVAAGKALFNARCAACHGREGRGGVGGELAGGNPDLTAEQPDKTIGSYWPYAPTLFDFIRRAMPLTAPWSLSDDEVYGLVAYLLALNGLPVVEPLDAHSLATVRMPNRDGFRWIDVTASGSLKSR